MHESIQPVALPRALLLAALPAVLASFVVLAVAGVDARLMWSQAAFVAVAVLVAYATAWLPRTSSASAALSLLVVSVALCAVPLLTTEARPARWLSLGVFQLYCAPVLVPAALLAVALVESARASLRRTVWALLCTLAFVLALQPDASQVLAISAAMVPIALHRCGDWRVHSAVLLPFVALVVFAFAQPDPLQPVAYVEEVFAVAWRASIALGATVALGALTWLLLLWRVLARVHPAATAIALYYLVLFGCSIAGLTPAPLIGYGVGPVLGYGLLVAMAKVCAGPTVSDASLLSRLDQ